jgi:hypothetical protein
VDLVEWLDICIHSFMKLINLPSGSIDLITIESTNSAKLVLQFNASCEDSLPFCKAICCRMQSILSAEVKQEEIKLFGKRNAQLFMPVKLLQENECLHLDSNTKFCKVHSNKPYSCKSWHCSPQGKGDGIIVRGQGWVLLPTTS